LPLVVLVGLKLRIERKECPARHERVIPQNDRLPPVTTTS
jgi:hypothetical protein